jgi:hypothetical protein
MKVDSEVRGGFIHFNESRTSRIDSIPQTEFLLFKGHEYASLNDGDTF